MVLPVDGFVGCVDGVALVLTVDVLEVGVPQIEIYLLSSELNRKRNYKSRRSLLQAEASWHL